MEDSEQQEEQVKEWFFSQHRIRVAGAWFALVFVLKLIGMVIGDTFDFTAGIARAPWWPHVFGAAFFASTFPWLSLEDGYFTAVELKKKLIHGTMLALVLPAMKLLDILAGIGGFDDISWPAIALWSLLAFICAWIPHTGGG